MCVFLSYLWIYWQCLFSDFFLRLRRSLKMARLCTACGQRGHDATMCWHLAPIPPPLDRPPPIPPREPYPPVPNGLAIRRGGLNHETFLVNWSWLKMCLRLCERNAVGLAWRG